MLLHPHPKGFPWWLILISMTFSSFLPFCSQAALFGRGLCRRHPCGTLKMPVWRRVAEVRLLGAIRVGCCRGGESPSSLVHVSISDALIPTMTKPGEA